jgi:hypothetical protein
MIRKTYSDLGSSARPRSPQDCDGGWELAVAGKAARIDIKVGPLCRAVRALWVPGAFPGVPAHLLTSCREEDVVNKETAGKRRRFPQLCGAPRCPNLVHEVGVQFCPPHEEQAQRLTEQPLAPELVDIANAHNFPDRYGLLIGFLTNPFFAEWARNDLDGFRHSLPLTNRITNRNVLGQRVGEACGLCGRIGDPVAFQFMPDIVARICEACLELTGSVVIQYLGRWCPRCRKRPEDPLCEHRSRTLMGWAEWIAPDQTQAMAAAALVACTNAHHPLHGHLSLEGGRVQLSDLALADVVDDLRRLSFLLFHEAERVLMDGQLGPGWKRRVDGRDIKYDDAQFGDDPREQLLHRLHANALIAEILAVAGPAQVRAIARLSEGHLLDGAERQALFRLRKRLSSAHLAAFHDLIG